MEGVVELLIPPAAREAVAGDLRELYSSPRQYGLAALKALPCVIASQARRNANLPLLGLQGVILYASIVTLAPAWSAEAMLLTLLALLVLLLRDAYQPVRRPATRIAILQTQGVSFLVLIYFMTLGRGYHVPDSQLSPLLIVLPFSMPLLVTLRAFLILHCERQQPLPDAEMTFEDMARDYRGFAERARRANGLEIVALFLAMAVGTGLVLYFGPATAPIGWALLCLFALAAAWLLLRGTAPALQRMADFAALRMLYRHELARQGQIRRFMWWLWFSPAFACFVAIADHGLVAGRPVLTAFGLIPMAFTGFCIAALNRERGGWVQENIVALALMRERRPF
jgi:hypothetical protein